MNHQWLPSRTQIPTAGRLPYLDWLKFLVVLSLAPFHAALSFTGMGVVYVYDTPVRDALLSHTMKGAMGPRALQIFTVFMDNWFMHLLFLISGVGAAASLRKRTARRFVGERANRLLLPLLVGTLVVISFQAWLRALSFGTFTGGFFAFYPTFFNGISSGPGSRYNFDYGQLWFLLYLFVFSMIALPLFLRLNRVGDSSPLLRAGRRLAASAAILLPALWIGVLEAVSGLDGRGTRTSSTTGRTSPSIFPSSSSDTSRERNAASWKPWSVIGCSR